MFVCRQFSSALKNPTTKGLGYFVSWGWWSHPDEACADGMVANSKYANTRWTVKYTDCERCKPDVWGEHLKSPLRARESHESPEQKQWPTPRRYQWQRGEILHDKAVIRKLCNVNELLYAPSNFFGLYLVYWWIRKKVFHLSWLKPRKNSIRKSQVPKLIT